jgi:hypothetical protein
MNPRTIFAAVATFCIAIIGVAFVGCGNGRPPGIADRPGESFVELSDLQAELVGDTDLKIKVHYHFPDGLPHPDAWFTFYFDVNGGNSGTIPVRKQGRDLSEDGDVDAATSAKFLKKKAVSFGVKVQQSPNKGGPWHDVSERLNVDF